MACGKYSLLLFLVFLSPHFIQVLPIDNAHEKRSICIFFQSPLEKFPRMFSYKKQKDGNYSFEGMFYEMIQDINVYFGIRAKYSFVDGDEVKKRGLYATLIKHLNEKDVEFVPYPFEQEWNSLQHMELSTTIQISPLKILQPWPAEESRLTVTIRPFELMVWCGFIGSTALFIFVTTAFIKIQEKWYDESDENSNSVIETFHSQIVYVLTIMLNQGNSIPYQAKDSFKILVGIWLLSMVVLINSYAGVMTALLTVPKLEPIANTVEEAVVQNRKFTLEQNRTLTRQFMDATGGYQKIIADQFRQDPTLFAKDPLTSIDNVLKRQCVLVTTELLVDFAINEDTKANNDHCRMTSSAELKGYKAPGYQFGLPLESPLAPAVNNLLLRFTASGFGDFYRKKYFPSTPKCRSDNPPETTTHPLTLFELVAAFFILGVGLPISLLAFLAEITVRKSRSCAHFKT